MEVNATSSAFAQAFWTALGGAQGRVSDVAFRGRGAVASAFAATDLAAGSIAAAGLAIAELLEAQGHGTARVVVDRRLAGFWFATSLRPIGWKTPDPWDPMSGDYEASDGWIRLHTNVPRHRAAARGVLGVDGDREAVARSVAGWGKRALETAIVEAGGCAAEMLDVASWRMHPQGAAVAAEPLAWIDAVPGTACGAAAPADRPLQGIRVLDLTRVVAGPVGTRFLAGFGADVLRIDPYDWDEPGLVPEVQAGKRSARMDLRDPSDRRRFEALLAGADLFVHSLRPAALEGLGYGPDFRAALAPGCIDVSVDAYGWTGPWSGRRGFDSLVQMSSGIAAAGMRWAAAARPRPLPFQGLDHAAGYLMAAAAVRGLCRRATDGGRSRVRISLARIAALLTGMPHDGAAPAPAPETEADIEETIEATDWGTARRLKPPVTIGGLRPVWRRPARALGSDLPEWLH